MHQPIRVALVGRRLEHNENLGLSYLVAALRRARIDVERHYVNDAAELEAAYTSISERPPDVVGLSLADGGSALLPLALGEALSRAGYQGHVTAGGQFATLARDWLLERHAWLGSVVRFAGERPIVEIAQRVRQGVAVHGIQGVTTRAGDGEPAGVLDVDANDLRPMRDELPEIMGHQAAHIAASRGCLGRCQYCGPAALHTLERREGVRAGIDKAVLTRAGVGGVRRRELDAVCDEMAELWHERGVRYFYFVDEHLLPYTEPEALDHLEQWKHGLEQRSVGAFGIGTMLRADRITPRICRAFADLGLVRVFVGLELATEEEGRRFGRKPPGQDELALLSVLASEGVVTVSNLMLVNPYSTPDTIRAGINLLERVPHGVFEATRMMVYHGTRLCRTMADEGRLIGNPFRYGYTFDDPRVERFAEIFTRLRAEAFWNYSVAFRTHDAFLALALTRRLRGDRVERSLIERIERTRRAVNRCYVTGYRRALELAEAGGGFVEAGPLVRELRPAIAQIVAELDSVEARLAELGARAGRPFAPMRAAASSVVTFVLAAACARETRSVQSGEREGMGGVAGAAASGAPIVSLSIVADAAPSSAELVYPDAGTGEGGSLALCAASEREASNRDVERDVRSVDACFSGQVELGEPPRATFALKPVAGGGRLCAVRPRADGRALQQALAGRAARCVEAGGRPPALEITGGGQRDAEKVAKAVARCGVGGTGGFTPAVRVFLDAKGRVQRVDGGKSQRGNCIKQVLMGLSFPCLASFEVCAEHVIIE